MLFPGARGIAAGEESDISRPDPRHFPLILSSNAVPSGFGSEIKKKENRLH
jgi:hypothetical protein